MQSSHYHIVIPLSYHQLITSSPGCIMTLLYHHICTSWYDHIFISSHIQIIISSRHDIITSSHHHVITSWAHHNISSSLDNIMTCLHHCIIMRGSSHDHIKTSSRHHIITSSESQSKIIDLTSGRVNYYIQQLYCFSLVIRVKVACTQNSQSHVCVIPRSILTATTKYEPSICCKNWNVLVLTWNKYG